MPDPDSLQSLLHLKWNMGLTWPAFLDFSRKNVEAMRANAAKTEIDPALAERVKSFAHEARLLVLGADWCGDVVANIPSVARLAALNPKLQLRVLDRDRHMDLMKHFQTNGGNAIPIAIVSSGDFSRRVRWGPRPGPCQAIMDENKGKLPKEEIYPMIHKWYEEDKNRALLEEIWSGISAAAAPAP